MKKLFAKRLTIMPHLTTHSTGALDSVPFIILLSFNLG